MVQDAEFVIRGRSSLFATQEGVGAIEQTHFRLGTDRAAVDAIAFIVGDGGIDD